MHLHHRKYFLSLCILQFLISSLCGQHKFAWPIDSPFVITGNYGEIRPNHFHAGLDFSTSGKVNLPVFAVEDGYVSRIRVSPVGYGRSLYITHPGGKVSVYAHLNSFNLKIDQIIKEKMLAAQVYEIDFLVPDRSITVKKNEIIALSGNTGGSTGPHLHFEIRDERSEVPLNPLQYYKIKDHTPPALTHAAFYDLGDTLAPKWMKTIRLLPFKNDSLVFEKDHMVLPASIIGFAFSGFDRFSVSANQNNIYAASLYFDDQLVYSHTLDHIDFSDGRYVNEFCDVLGRVKFQKCFVPAVYPLALYASVHNKGRILLTDTAFHKLKLVVKDEAGNSTVTQVFVRASRFNFYHSPPADGEMVNCAENFTVSKNGLFLNIPARTLYRNVSIKMQNDLLKNRTISILPSKINLNAAVTVGFKVPADLMPIKNKIVLRNSSGVAVPVCRQDSLFLSIKNFDTYELKIDTLPPVITVPKQSPGRSRSGVSFRLTDKLSGVARFNLFLNNKWVLADYDAKVQLLTYTFDEGTPAGILNFRLEAEDRVGNSSSFFYLLKH